MRTMEPCKLDSYHVASSSSTVAMETESSSLTVTMETTNCRFCLLHGFVLMKGTKEKLFDHGDNNVG